MYFNHRFGCHKCFVCGIFDKDAHRMCFPEFNVNRRTDSSFRNRVQPLHHKTTSSLEYLQKADGVPMLDMVMDFPTSDPLHLLEEGVMKKCLNMWMKGKTANKRKKWTNQMIDNLNKQIVQWNREMPNDFNRKLRTLQYFSYYKATEYRSLLLYIGMVAFKNVLSKDEYVHFLSLSLAIRLFSCKYYVQQEKLRKIATLLLSEYCENFIKIYGKTEVVSNVHNLSHIAEDVQRFGNLNEISTYPFENFLHEIKLRVKASNNPMEQITRRLIEQSINDSKHLDFTTKVNAWVPELKYEFKETNTSLLIYKFIRITPKVSFSSKNIADKWFITKSDDIVEMKFAIKKLNSFFIFGAPIIDKNDFFQEPYLSRKTDIYLSRGEKGEPKFYEHREIKAKMICLSYLENYVFIPLLHSYDDCLIENF